jgi:predicted DNA binding CopG/RHH family protein
MGKNKKRKRDPLPDQFSSPEEAGEFWDTHSGTDYEEYMTEVHFDVELKRRAHEVRVTDQLLREVRKIARQQGVSTETLVNLWLQEKVAATTKHVS